MISFLKKIYVSFKGTKLWLKSIDLAKSRNYREAKHCLEKIELLGINKNIEYCLLRGVIEYINKESASSKEYLKLAIIKIEKVTRYSENEKKYLVAYAQGMIHEIDTSNSNIDYCNIDLEAVANHLKDKFPLIEHPRWEKG